MKNPYIILGIAAVVVSIGITACGEDLEQITSSNKIMAQSYEELVECNASNEGKLAYVKDSSAVYLCADSVWKEMYTTEFEEVDVKNGTDGKNGSDGKNGTNGKDGQNGKNGTDGKNGKDGQNGANGTSCTVSAIKDGSGYDVLCGGEKVGQLLSAENGEKGSKGVPGDKGGNGPKGDNGADGTNCTAKALADGSGFELSCDGKAVGTIKNGVNGEKGAAGTSCSAKSLEDGSGFEISCGGTVVGTLKNGASHTGVGCSFDDDGEGTITVKCGSNTEVVKVYKAVCGITPYNPDEKTCLGVDIENGNIKAVLAPLCGGKPYNPEDPALEDNDIALYLSSDSKQTCKDGVIYDLCGDDEYNAETQFCVKNKIYDFCEGQVYNVDLYYCEPHANLLFGNCGEQRYRVKYQKCESGKILDLCGDEYIDRATHFCRDNKVYALCGGNKQYNPQTQVCEDDKVLTKCKDELYDASTHFCNNDQIYIRCGGAAYDPQQQKCVDNKIENRTFCNNEEYDNKTHFCGGDELVQPLCDGEMYTPIEICIEGKILPKCGDIGYDSKLQACINGKLYNICKGFTYDPETHVCKDGKVLTKCGEAGYDPVTHFCGTNNQITLRCGEQLEDYDLETQKCEEGKVLTQCGETYYYPPEQKCVNNKVEDRYFCGEGDNKKEYDKTKQFCDTRDNHVYKFIHFYNEQSKKPYYPVYWIAEDVTYYSNNVGYRLNWFTWETAQSACPKGWHLPTKKEFELLIYKAGGSDIAGKNLKSIEGWSTASEALDRYGFSATPSGYDFEGSDLGDGLGSMLGLWWSSTDEGDSVYVLEMHNNSDAATVKLWPKKSSMETDMNYSVRCIWVGRSTKDTP